MNKLTKHKKGFVDWKSVGKKLKHWPVEVLLRKILLLEIGILALGLLGAVWIIVLIFFVQVNDHSTQLDKAVELNTETIDEMELWLEVRQGLHDRQLQFNSSVLAKPDEQGE